MSSPCPFEGIRVRGERLRSPNGWSVNLCVVALTVASRAAPRVAVPAALLTTAALVVGCSKADPKVVVANRLDIPSPSKDPNGDCADVGGSVRVCWGAKPALGANDAVAFERPVPALAVSSLGFRCTGVGAGRRCRDRELDAPPFRCNGEVCTERHPRVPDDGEWECAAIAGAVVCRGGQSPAGVPRGAVDSGFFCGNRTARGVLTGERVCVDFSPDFPDGNGAGLRCRYEAERGLARVCEPDRNARAVGDACDRARPCVDGAHCVSGRCVPGRPEPSCWIPADCDHGTCRFGTCTEDTP